MVLCLFHVFEAVVHFDFVEVMMETTNNIFNKKLYDLVKPESVLVCHAVFLSSYRV